MQVNIPYGKGNVKVNVPEDHEILVPNEASIKDEEKLIEEALDNPIGFESYDEFADDADRLLVIINDAARPVSYTHLTLPTTPYV